MQYLLTSEMKINSKEYMQTYTYIIRICDEQDKAADLYQIYQHILLNYVRETIAPRIQMKTGDTRAFLEEYCFQWKQFTLFTFSMKKMFDYLDRYYLKNGNEGC